MISDLDAYQAAKILIDQRGPMADAFAASRIEELLQEGDFEGAMAWRRILGAIQELLREPREDEEIH